MLEKIKKLDLSRFIFLSILPQILVFAISLVFIALDLEFDKYGVIQTFLILPLSFVILPYLFLVKSGEKISLKNIGIRNFSSKTICIFSLLIILITAVIYSLGKWNYSIIFFALQTLVVSISEELWARGMLINELKKSKFSQIICVLVSSLIFAFITHQNRPVYENLTNRFPFAIIMGLIYYRTQKIELPILIHFANNMIGGI